MGGNSAPKRKLKEDDALKPAAKYPKVLDEPDEHEDDEHPHAYTRFPPEILLDIFDYLKPEDNCMKKLSEVCKKFKNLCSPRLSVLQLDFNVNIERNRYPVIQRGYSKIRMLGDEIDCNRAEIAKILESSRETARKLVIKMKDDESKKRCKIKMRTLLFILQFLPNLEVVKIKNVEGLLPQFDAKAIKPSERSRLPNLKKLILVNVTVFSAFTRASNIEVLKSTELRFNSRREWQVYREIVAKQKNLRSFCSQSGGLRILQSTLVLFEVIFEHLLARNPKLEHIKISYVHPRWGTTEIFTAGAPVSSLKTIELYGASARFEYFDLDRIRRKFPSLERFKCLDYEWSVGKGLSSI